MSLSERYSSILDKCIHSLSSWKNLINEGWDHIDTESEIEKWRVIAEEYCIIDNNHKRSEKAIQSLGKSITDPSKSYNIDDMFNECLAEHPLEDITSNEIWQDLIQENVSVQEVKPKKKKDDTQYEEVDDSLLCSNSFTAPVDPICKKIIRKPIRNRKCKHVYDSGSIYDYIRQSKNKAKCPYMGCKNNKLVSTDLQLDIQLEKKISKYLESQRNETSENESE